MSWRGVQGRGVRYIPGLDLVKAAGHPQTVSASLVLEDWYRAILEKAALCRMGASPALFPRCTLPLLHHAAAEAHRVVPTNVSAVPHTTATGHKCFPSEKPGIHPTPACCEARQQTGVLFLPSCSGLCSSWR